MKYIDADKLKRFEEMLADIIVSSQGLCTYEACKDVAKSEAPALIGSLQQEQPDFPTTDEQIKEFLATHPKVEVPDKYKTPDWLFKKQEQQKVDLEKEIKDTCRGYRINDSHEQELGKQDIENVARHFYELGKNGK